MTESVIFTSVPETAKRSGVSKDHIYVLCHTGRIEYLMIGKKYMVHYPHFIQYLESEAREKVIG